MQKTNIPLGPQSTMTFGNMPRDGGHLFLTTGEANALKSKVGTSVYVRRFVGAESLTEKEAE